MSAKVLFLGVDALDSAVIRRYEADLPNISRLLREGDSLPVMPIHPPDSDTAWATITTGLDPSEHGIVKYDDPLEKTNRLTVGDIDNTAIRTRTFWDVASRAGKRVCVLFPHLGYPVWPVNGIMIGRSGFNDQPDFFPRELSFPGWDLHTLNVISGMPDRTKTNYLRANRDLLENQTRFALELMAREPWDLFFLYSSVLDMIQHYFWNYCDSEDPTWPGPNPYQNVVRDFYHQQDEIVGRLMAKAGKDAVVFVVSDHGHGMRPARVFNLNEYLRRCGWLVRHEGAGRRTASGLVESSKSAAMRIIGQYGLGSLAVRILRYLPFLRKVYSQPMLVDWNRTRAYATNLSGIKAYSYGGIIVPHAQNPGAAYEETRLRIIAHLEKVCLDDGSPVFRWIQRREDVYHGPYLEKYPDILFEMRYGLGAGLVPGGELYGRSPSHQIVPGSHRGDTPVWIQYPGKQERGLPVATPAQRKAMILDALGVHDTE